MIQERIEKILNKKLYFTLCDYGDAGLSFQEYDPENDTPIEEQIIDTMTGVYAQKVIKVIEVDLINNSVSDVSSQIEAKTGLKMHRPSNPTNADMARLTDFVDLYFTLNDFDHLGVSFLEMDPAQDYKQTILDHLKSTDIDKPLAIIKVNLTKGSVENISTDMAIDWLKMIIDEDDLFNEDFETELPEFIKSHFPHKLIGEKSSPKPNPL